MSLLARLVVRSAFLPALVRPLPGGRVPPSAEHVAELRDAEVDERLERREEPAKAEPALLEHVLLRVRRGGRGG